MMDTVFLQIYDMSKVAGIVISAVLLVRLCLKRAPKVFSYALWAIVLFRLLCPASIESPVSLIPKTEPTIQSYDLLDEAITPLAAMDAAQQAVGDVLNGGIGIQHVRTSEFDEDGTRRVVSTDWGTVWILFTKYVWIGGMAILLIYSTVSMIRLRGRLVGAVRLRENIYLSDYINSPFVMGLVRPKIYLPSSLCEKERAYIILHEQHHIRRGDHIVKLISFGALCLHCFNPLVWIAFILSGKDMEMSCDEAVLRKLGEDIRVDYSASLISLATGRRIIAGTPLAFGEGNTEGRIKNISKWKKPAVWVIVVAVIVCVVLTVCLITNPMNRDTMLLGAEYRTAERLYDYDGKEPLSDWNYEHAWICIGADFSFWVKSEGFDWFCFGIMCPDTLDSKQLEELTAQENGWVGRRPGKIAEAYILTMEGGLCYRVCITERGEVLYGAGSEEELWFLMRLESTFGGTHLSGEFYERSLAQNVGGDVEIFHTHYDERHPNYMLVGFKADDSPYQDGVQLPSDEKTDMGFAVFYQNKDKSGYRLLQCHVYEDAALAENGIYLCPDPAVFDSDGEMKPKTTYDVILLNNERIEKATRIWKYADKKTKTESQGYLNGHEMVLFSRENDKAGCQITQHFYDEHGVLIAETGRSLPVLMTPTAANITGVFDAYLYVPIDGANYRYERVFDNPASVTKGKLMYEFKEKADPEDVEWRIYAVDDYPDRSVVLAESGDDYIHLYRYSPSKAVDPSRLIAAKASGMITLEDGYATYEQKLWTSFYLRTQDGEPASVKIAHYHTLENGNYSGEYYEAYKDDYPSLSVFELTYDGKIYTLTWEENGTPYVRTYKYLMKEKSTVPTSYSAKEPQQVTYYILKNDKDASLEELFGGMLSAKLGDEIEFFTIYREKET